MPDNDFTTQSCNICQLEFPLTDEYWHKNKMDIRQKLLLTSLSKV